MTDPAAPIQGANIVAGEARRSLSGGVLVPSHSTRDDSCAGRARQAGLTRL